MKKQTKVLLAAALFTLGASFSSMAALKNGTWVLNEEGWQYADKDGEYVENEWCVSYGKEYWINEEGVLGASEWVEDGNDKYYVQSDGSKTVNNWKYLYADEDADEESWFFFDEKGKMVKNASKTINGNKYYFDGDGKMLTGWVDSTKGAIDSADNSTDISKIVYTNENGALVKSSWINMYPWTMTEDDAYAEDYNDYYADSEGKLKKSTKTKIDGLSYIFDANGVMLTGWVQKIGGVYTDADAAISASTTEAYFCDKDNGYVKTNSWRKLDDPTGDDDAYWYYFDKNGKAFIATDANAVIVTNKATFKDGEVNSITTDSNVSVNVKKIDGVEYYFNMKGEMIDGLQYIGGKLMYLKGGVKQTGKVTLTDKNENDYTFYFADKNNNEERYEKYVAVEGNKDGYCYKNGQLITSDDKDVYEVVYTANGDFVVDYRGKIQHTDNKEYEGAGKFTFNQTSKGAAKYSIK